MHWIASGINWGSVPDWIAGVGSVLAFGGFAVALIREIKLRRRDDKAVADDRADALKRHARLVYVASTSLPTQTRLVVHNQGSGPIIDLSTTVWVRSNTSGNHREILLSHREPDETIVSAGSSGESWLWFADGESLAEGQEYFPQVEFTDCEGIRWRRRNNEQPVRVVDGS